jgi:hypothetical protein
MLFSGTEDGHIIINAFAILLLRIDSGNRKIHQGI